MKTSVAWPVFVFPKVIKVLCSFICIYLQYVLPKLQRTKPLNDDDEHADFHILAHPKCEVGSLVCRTLIGVSLFFYMPVNVPRNRST